MPNLMGVYYMATHLVGVGGTAKAKLYGMDGDYQSGYNGKAKTGLAEYMLQQHAGRNWVCTTILKGETENDEW